jgi:3-polyprenyl-4-hydroxybenzoate decarboxylase
MGIIIMPPVLTYYNHPKTLEEMTTHIVGKIMDQFDLDGGIYRRWEGVKKNI